MANVTKDDANKQTTIELTHEDEFTFLKKWLEESEQNGKLKIIREEGEPDRVFFTDLVYENYEKRTEGK